jgi:hypothetical protein
MKKIALNLPGDNIVPQPDFHGTSVITIDASPGIIGRWVIQNGGRTGRLVQHRLDR